MKRLLKLTEQIEDKELRKKVVEFLKDSRLSSKHFQKYSKEKLKNAGSMFNVPTSAFGPMERDIVNHTIALTELCMKATQTFKKNYDLDLNRDALIAASIVHDLMKAFEYKRDEDGDLVPSGIMLDHTMLGVAELYSRNFPEDVIHIVASHYGESGPTPPRSFEAVIFHHLDSLASVVEYYVQSKKELEKRAEEELKRKISQLTEEELRKLSEHAEESE